MKNCRATTYSRSYSMRTRASVAGNFQKFEPALLSERREASKRGAKTCFRPKIYRMFCVESVEIMRMEAYIPFVAPSLHTCLIRLIPDADSCITRLLHMTKLVLAGVLIIAIIGLCVNICIFCERSTHVTIIIPVESSMRRLSKQLQHACACGSQDIEFPMIAVGAQRANYDQLLLPSVDSLETSMFQ